MNKTAINKTTVRLQSISQILSEYNIDDYADKYIAMESVVSNRIVATSESFNTAYKVAQQKNIEHPVMMYVPARDVVYI